MRFLGPNVFRYDCRKSSRFFPRLFKSSHPSKGPHRSIPLEQLGGVSFGKPQKRPYIAFCEIIFHEDFHVTAITVKWSLASQDTNRCLHEVYRNIESKIVDMDTMRNLSRSITGMTRF